MFSIKTRPKKHWDLIWKINLNVLPTPSRLSKFMPSISEKCTGCGVKNDLVHCLIAKNLVVIFTKTLRKDLLERHLHNLEFGQNYRSPVGGD